MADAIATHTARCSGNAAPASRFPPVLFIWGGTAGEQFDPCYHEACDTFGNLAEHALEVNSDLIAYAMLTFAYSTESVNGVPGRRVPGPRDLQLVEPAGPEGTYAEEDGGLNAPYTLS